MQPRILGRAIAGATGTMASPFDVEAVDKLAAQLGDTYGRFDQAERARHAALVASVERPGDVALDAEDRGDGTWRVVVCTTDAIGALSVIAGLFTAYRFDILSADIFTLHFPERRIDRPATDRIGRSRRRPLSASPIAPAHKLLDIFEVRSLDRVSAEVWERFRSDLATLMALVASGQRESAQDEVVSRIGAAFRVDGAGDAKLLPVSTEFFNEPSSPHTRLVVRSVDMTGFLFAFTYALAGFTVNVERAQIRSLRGEAVDTFWVTDLDGRQIVGEERIHELRVATALVKHFTHLLPRSPNPGQALRQFSALIQQMLSRPQWTIELANLESPAVLEALADLMGVSRFLWEDFLRLQHENLFPVVVDVPALTEKVTKQQLRSDLARRLGEATSIAEQTEALNAFKDRTMFRVDLRHITGRSTFAEFAAELSTLAEVTVEVAADLTQAALAPQFGVPTLADGRICPLCICALGKFGGAELGFGSDLELIFVYEDEGQTNGPTSILNSEYCSRFVQAFLKTLKARQEGIFEIDLRLRPHGRAGPLAITVDGFARYYSEHGGALQFERMALVKLRPITGPAQLGDRISRARDDFVYSGKPLDIGNVLHLRHRQATELVPAGRTNAKYSRGGLVDVEYFVQAWQIAVGHADPSVRVTNTLEGISRLAAGRYIPDELAVNLRECYGFLRRLIDALRVVRGHAKDLTIPPATSREFAYLAQRLQFASPMVLDEVIATRMAFARELWDSAALPQS